MIGHVLRVGACSPIGATALQTAMCVRARKLEPRSTPLVDKRGQAVGMCRIDGIGDDVYGYERMIAIATPALREAAPEGDQKVPLLVAVPEPGRPDDDPRWSSFATDLARKAGVAIDTKSSRVIRAGHAGGAAVFVAAGELLRSHERVVVGGVDSYYHPEVLRWLDEGYRLHALGAEDGFIPGEAAAFLALARSGPGVARLTDAACADERAEPAIGQAMTVLMRSIATRRGTPRWLLNDINGEHHRVREWGLVLQRGVAENDFREVRPAGDLGDVGAASGPMFAALACSWWSAGCAHDASCTIALASEGGERGVARLERGGPR